MKHPCPLCTPPSTEIRVSRWVDLGNLGGAVSLSAWCSCLSEPRLLAGCKLCGEQLGARGNEVEVLWPISGLQLAQFANGSKGWRAAGSKAASSKQAQASSQG